MHLAYLAGEASFIHSYIKVLVVPGMLRLRYHIIIDESALLKETGVGRSLECMDQTNLDVQQQWITYSQTKMQLHTSCIMQAACVHSKVED